MKIFLVSNMYPSLSNPDHGVFVRNFKMKMEDKGVVFSNISVIKGKSRGILQKLLNYSKHYVSVFKNFRGNKYDIIYIHYISHNAPILAFLLLVFSKRTPIVVNVHGSDIIKYNTGIFRVFNRYLLKQTNLLVVPSEYFKGIVKDNFQFYKSKKIFINPSGGVDLSMFFPEKKLEDEINDYCIGYVSRIDEGKGWDHFVNALSILKNDGVKFKAIMAGEGVQEKLLESKIMELKIEKDVVYLGAIEQEELVTFYNSMDIFVFPSTRAAESLGLVGLEAMACGVPVIASNMAGPGTYVINHVNGFLTSPGNIFQIADFLKEYNNYSKEKRAIMQENAIATAKKYDSELTANKLYSELEKLVE